MYREKLGNPSLTLVNELVEGVLAIGARLAPDDGSCGVVDPLSTAGHIFTIGLHVSLLEIGSKPMHVLKTENII